MCTPSSDGRNTRTGIAALPFCHISLKTKLRVNPAYPKALNRLGDHIKTRRLNLKLSQKAVAGILKVDEMTIAGWEKNRCTPCISQMPKIIEFIGYIPYNKDFTYFKDKLQYFRRLSGLSQEKLAKLLKIDETTIAKWERGEHSPSRKLLKKLNEFFSSYQDIS